MARKIHLQLYGYWVDEHHFDVRTKFMHVGLFWETFCHSPVDLDWSTVFVLFTALKSWHLITEAPMPSDS